MEVQIVCCYFLRNVNDLANMHRNGKLNYNRFPFFCLWVLGKRVDHFLTALHYSGLPTLEL